MIKVKTRIGLVICTVCLFIIVLFISFCNQDDKQINQKKGKPLNVWSKFVASGWMGDGKETTEIEYVQLNEAWRENPHSAPLCIKITYTLGPEGWAGIYWQNKPDNFGDKPGDNFQRIGYKKVTFWARGENGDEVVEFKAGGINESDKKYKDSFEAKLGKVVLERNWQQFTIDLEGQDLSSVIGGFCWVASRDANPDGLTFYLDDIYYTF